MKVLEKKLTPRQAQRREAVISAAMELALEGGYEAVQMREVSNRANVALGTVYRYFSSKDQLLVGVLNEWVLELQRRVETRPLQGATPAERVHDVVLRALRALDRSPSLTEALVTALSSVSAADPDAVAETQVVYENMQALVAAAMGDEGPEERDAIIRVIGSVWMAALIARTRGWAGPTEMRNDLEAALHLLLPEEKNTRRAAAGNRRSKS
ncbi:MAG TPA: TetR family transcriptional regulator [Actinomycetota bacterium]|nr:TetR family transcriptional regulator [Actinomycetota bacterium]